MPPKLPTISTCRTFVTYKLSPWPSLSQWDSISLCGRISDHELSFCFPSMKLAFGWMKWKKKPSLPNSKRRFVIGFSLQCFSSRHWISLWTIAPYNKTVWNISKPREYQLFIFDQNSTTDFRERWIKSLYDCCFGRRHSFSFKNVQAEIKQNFKNILRI